MDDKRSLQNREAFRCPVYKKCGGCQLDVPYPAQLAYKQRTVIELLGRFGHVEPILAMDEPLHYRCKVSTAFGYAGGRVLSGVWQSSSGRLTPVDGCALEDPRAAEIVRVLRELLPRHRLQTYDPRTGRGFLRFVTIRIGRQTGEILVALGTGTGATPDRFVRELLTRCPQITTLTRHISTDRLNLILGERETVLHGPGYIVDRLCGLAFQISARSFFQVNPVQTERLYQTAVDFAALDGSQRVIDAYCGVGTIGMIAAAQAREVLSVESNAAAVKNARENLRRNDLRNVRVVQADAGALMTELAAAQEPVDVVFTDPPRAGCSREFLQALCALAPERVVYVSCNPETQARDLQSLTRQGYRVRRIQPVDMFPYTRHVECVVLLSRDSH